jgi:hypothetical protein
MVKTLPEMTCAIYLFHLWLWPHLIGLATAYGPSFINLDLQVVVMWFSICFVLCKTVEQYGVNLSKRIVTKVYKEKM